MHIHLHALAGNPACAALALQCESDLRTELLDALEPSEKKWPLLALLYMERAMGATAVRVAELCTELAAIDPPRAGYYADTMSRVRSQEYVCARHSVSFVFCTPPLSRVLTQRSARPRVDCAPMLI